MNIGIKEIAFWVMLIMIIGLGIYSIRWINSESFQCVSNPYTYSINLMEKANGGDVYCQCSSPKGNVMLTREGFSESLITREVSEW